MAIYKVVIDGQHSGQAVTNTLFYRTGLGIDVGGFDLGGAKALADVLKAEVWPRFKECLPTDYMCNAIKVYPFDDGTFNLLYSMPYELPVRETGGAPLNTDGPASCAIIRFNLEATALVTNGPKPPKRGYIAVGPCPSDWVDNTGHFNASLFNDPAFAYTKLANKLAENLNSLLPPVQFWPIRVSQMKVLGVFKITSFADVQGAALKRTMSFRRSRKPEA